MHNRLFVGKSGFTLVELLIVIVVIAVLAAISIVSYSGIQSRAQDTKRVDDLSKIAKGLQLWSIETDKTFQNMNTGWAGNGATGWLNTNYGGGSTGSILTDGGYILPGTEEPARTGTRGYLITPCTTNTDNRRVVMAQLDKAPDQTVHQQLAGHGCTSSYINTGINSYGANYAVLVVT